MACLLPMNIFFVYLLTQIIYFALVNNDRDACAGGDLEKVKGYTDEDPGTLQVYRLQACRYLF